MSIPEDVVHFLESCSLENRVSLLRKNLVYNFSDGILIAEIIHSKFPKIVPIHSFLEISNAEGRISNWNLLNDKVLYHFDINLSEFEIDAVIRRVISKEKIIAFFRLIRDKMYEFEEKYQEYLTSQKLLSKQTQILQLLEHKANVNKVAQTMNDEEIENLYKKFALKLRKISEKSTKESDELQRKSDYYDQTLTKLKAENTKELEKLTLRVHQLKVELKEIEDGKFAVDEKGEYKTLFPDASKALVPNVTMEQLIKEILNVKIESKDGDSESKASDSVNADVLRANDSKKKKANLPSSFFDENEIFNSVEAWETKAAKRTSAKGAENDDDNDSLVTKDADTVDVEDNNKNESINIRIPKMHLKAEHIETISIDGVDNTTREQYVLESSAQIAKDRKEKEFMVLSKLPHTGPVVTHQRIYHSNFRKYYYVDVTTGVSSWVPPANGIVQCTDSNRKDFFSIVQNGKVVENKWTL